MAMKFVVTEVTVENVQKGRTPYSVATVAYTYNGQARSQKIMSFANPASFAVVKTLNPGDNIEVEVSKNAQGYNQWDSVKTVSAEAAAAAPTGGRVTGSNYETKDERAARQVLIVKQSCLAQAVAYWHGDDGDTEDNILATAQRFVDWVFDNNLSLADMPNDDIA